MTQGKLPLQQYNDFLSALCIEREARGEPRDAKVAILRVIHNRCLAKNTTVPKVILHPFAFSSFNHSDVNSSYFPSTHLETVSFEDCLEMVKTGEGFTPDITKGATHYHSYEIGDKRWPGWAKEANFTVQVGHFRFYTNIAF